MFDILNITLHAQLYTLGNHVLLHEIVDARVLVDTNPVHR